MVVFTSLVVTIHMWQHVPTHRSQARKFFFYTTKSQHIAPSVVKFCQSKKIKRERKKDRSVYFYIDAAAAVSQGILSAGDSVPQKWEINMGWGRWFKRGRLSEEVVRQFSIKAGPNLLPQYRAWVIGRSVTRGLLESWLKSWLRPTCSIGLPEI